MDHAKRVLNAVSAKGHLKDMTEKGLNSFYITNDGDFVVQTTKKVAPLLKDTYVLLYRLNYLETAIELEFYSLKFKPWDAAIEGGSSRKPDANVKPVLDLTNEVKQLATLYASSENDLQRVQNEWNQRVAGMRQVENEEQKARQERFTDLRVAFSGFSNEEYAFEALTESVKDFNNKSAERNGNGLGLSVSELVNWKKVKGIEFFEDKNSQLKGKLLACAVGQPGSAQSGYIIFNAGYSPDSSQLILTRIEMLKVPGVIKTNYEHSRFEEFKNRRQLGITGDETYGKHAVYILDELVGSLNKYKNSPEFSNYMLAKRKNDERHKMEMEKKTAEAQRKDIAEREINQELNEKSFKLSSKAILSLQEGDIVCLNTFSDRSIESIFKSDIIAYVEKYNSAKTKLQLRIHQAPENSNRNIYENIRFVKGDLIWISLPMKDSRKYWSKCE
jgi:hypothetical protein